ncbi:MAG: hypothetical protein E7114_01325 [Bacteroidales bacterium]|nr:hypothetical protein [Bacteroidales bacterium]
MGVLSEIGRFVCNVFELIAIAIGALIAAAIWAVGQVIDLATDILSWINGNIESLLDDGAKDVNVVRGDALSDFIKQNQATGKYTEISLDQLNAMHNSVINVATDRSGNVVDDQMIRSDKGLSREAKTQFNGQPTLKIKIAA